jgi:chromosome segregation ATPase
MRLHDDLLALQPEGARHDSDICPFCVEKASQSTASDPSGSGRPDVSSKSENKSTEGGTTPTMSDISQEAHEALLKKAVDDAVAAAVKTTEQALATKTEEAAAAVARVTELETQHADLTADNDRLNKELDAAQVSLKSATEEVASLKTAADEAAKKAELAEVASKRAEQVKNLGLFTPEYVSEKASKWAGLDEAAWTEQVDEWKQLKPATATETSTTDAASAMTGTTEDLTKEKQDAASASDKPKARRAALGLA